MPTIHTIKKTFNWYLYRIGQIAQAISVTTKLSLINFFSGKIIIANEGPIISLTSYGKRVSTVFLTIESIAQGHILPKRIILWLDDAKIFENLPSSLTRLQRRGLEVKLTKNYGPHTKYYPYLISEQNFTVPLVTADDDMLYGYKWLSELYAAFLRNPDLIHCHRARIIKVKAEKLQPFATWEFANTEEPSALNYLEGVSGVIYPPKFLHLLKQAGEKFLTICQKNDDTWLNVNALRHGFRIKQIRKNSTHYPNIPGTNSMGLMHQNLGASGDAQIARTFSTMDISQLLLSLKDSHIH